MKRQEIVDKVIDRARLERSQAINAVEAVIDAIAESLSRGESVYLRKFATFKSVVKKAKTGRNIKGGYTVSIPARRSVKIVLSPELKARMNRDFTAE